MKKPRPRVKRSTKRDIQLWASRQVEMSAREEGEGEGEGESGGEEGAGAGAGAGAGEGGGECEGEGEGAGGGEGSSAPRRSGSISTLALASAGVDARVAHSSEARPAKRTRFADNVGAGAGVSASADVGVAERLLQVHVEQSPLHADNAAHAAAEGTLILKRATKRVGADVDAGTVAQYQDRAAARRGLHGQDAQPKMIERPKPEHGHGRGSGRGRRRAHARGGRERGRGEGRGGNTGARGLPPPRVDADGTNLGNRMLQKMGWRGGGLGKAGTGIAEPVVAQGAARGGPGLGSAGARAPAVGKHGTPRAGPGYKDALHRKTSARFEALMRSDD
eukprot:g5918.t1